MIGFIKKDLIIAKLNLKMLIATIVMYTFLAYFEIIDISILVPILSVTVMLSTFSYDSYNKWDAYASSLPKGRENAVKGKYFATLILIVLSTVLMALILFSISYFRDGKIAVYDIFFSLFLQFFLSVLLGSIMYPLIFKFGVEKLRIISFFVIFIFIFFAINVLSYIPPVVITFLTKYYLLIIPAITFLIFAISYYISKIIYLKKEF